MRIDKSLPCRNRAVIAILISQDGEMFFGSNGIAVQREKCPRIELNMKRGEGWQICRDECGQHNHAEIAAIESAGPKAAGGTLYLFGHDTICAKCLKILRQAGVASWKITHPDIVRRIHPYLPSFEDKDDE